MRQLILISTLLTIISCGQTEIKDIISTYDTGEPELIYYYKDKRDTSTYRKEWFFKSGQLKYLGSVTKGKNDGVWIWWYEDGTIKDKCKYSNGYYLDTIYHYWPTGKIKELEIVRPYSVKQDSCRCCNETILSFYETGKIKKELTFVNNKKQGDYKVYYENGGWGIATYKNDSLWGPTLEHNLDSGKLVIVVGQYEHDKESGLWRWFDKDSTIMSTKEYQNGELSGLYIEYHTNGKIKLEGKLKSGYYDGIVKYFNESGELIKNEKYKDGELIN